MFGKVKYPYESINYKYLRMIIIKMTSLKHFVVEKSDTCYWILMIYFVIITDNFQIDFPSWNSIERFKTDYE